MTVIPSLEWRKLFMKKNQNIFINDYFSNIWITMNFHEIQLHSRSHLSLSDRNPCLFSFFLFFIFLFSLSSYIFLSIAWHSHLISVLWLLFPGLMITYSKFCACLAVNCWDLAHSYLAVSKVFLNERKGTPGIFSFGLTADSWDPHNHPLKFPSKLHVRSWIITS